MPICVELVGNTVTETGQELSDCTDFVLMSSSDFNLFNEDSFYTLLIELFRFDAGICGLVVGASLIMFFVSHSGGNIIRWLGRA